LQLKEELEMLKEEGIMKNDQIERYERKVEELIGEVRIIY